VVSTPAGEVEAKGTVFAVDVQPDRGARTRVIEGVVKVTRSAAGRRAADSFLVRAGEAGQVDGDAVAAEPAAREAVEQDLCLIHGCPAPEPGPLPGDGEDEAAEAELASAVEPSPPASSVSAGGRPRVETRPQPSATSAGPAPADPSPKEPEADEEWAVQTLVTLALDQRKSGRYPVAAETYRALIERHPGSAAAASALVSLGQLELVELGRPGQALGRFDAYLARAPNGLLAEEARLGRVRARARMGGPAALIAAADDYLKAHLGGYAGAEVTRRRADARRQLGDCAGAIADYRQVQSLWPTSPENARAAKGLEACGEQP